MTIFPANHQHSVYITVKRVTDEYRSLTDNSKQLREVAQVVSNLS